MLLSPLIIIDTQFGAQTGVLPLDQGGICFEEPPEGVEPSFPVIIALSIICRLANYGGLIHQS